MSHAEVCPVCKGRAYLNEVGFTGKIDTATETKCHGCDGKGWVTISDKQDTVITYIPYNPSTPPCNPWQHQYIWHDGTNFPPEEIISSESDYVFPKTTGDSC